VASFALATRQRDLLLVDPLLPAGADDLLDTLAAEASAVHILITIGYHARSAPLLSRRYEATIHGPETVRSRLGDEDRRFRPLVPGTPGPGGAVAYAIGRPRRSETPIWLPSHQAIAFGDALVTTPDGELRMWCQDAASEARVAFYRDRFAPTLAPLRALKARRILPTHGAPVVTRGAAALAAALDAPPWFHRG
jgi:hypothetical protein